MPPYLGWRSADIKVSKHTDSYRRPWMAEWFGRRTRDQKIEGLVSDPGSQTVA